MNPPNTWRWLVVAAVLLIALFTHHRYFRKIESAPSRILPKLDPVAVSGVEVLLGQGDIRAERTNGGSWSLIKPLSYAARGVSIEALLSKLAGLIPVTYIAPAELKDRPKADEEFGFANPQASILIEQGEEKIRLLIGRTTGPGDQLYLQVVGVDGIYIVDVDLMSLVPRNPADWRDTTVLNLKQLAFDRLAITNAGKLLLEFQRDLTNGLWRVGRGLRADGSKIEYALRKLEDLRITQFVTDDPKVDLEALGLQNPELEVALLQGSNNVALLQFGKTNKPGLVYARRHGESTIGTVSNELVAPWRAGVEEFLDKHLITLTRPVQTIEIQGEDSFSVQCRTNDIWQVMPQNFLADPAVVKDLLLALSGMNIDFIKDVVTPAGLADYGLASPTRRYRLQSAPESAGGPTNNIQGELHFGSKKDNQTYVRRTDESSVYAISTNDFERLPGTSWQFRQRRFWNISEDDITGVTIQKEGKKSKIIRKARYQWSLAPGSQGIINGLGVEETVRGLAQASAAKWVARGEQNRARYGFRDGNLQVTLELKNGDKALLEFGGEASPTYEYAGVTLDGQFWILEFSWPLFRDVLTTLPVP